NLPRVEAFNVIGATCQGALAKGARIGHDGTEMLCHRRSAATPVQIGFDATSFVNKDTPLGLAPCFPSAAAAKG
ncbi:MAG: hypothetical protein ACXW50_25135, partial [Candidatus Binatia bacterium]